MRAQSTVMLVRYLVPQWRGVSALGALLLAMTAIQIAHPRLLSAFIDGAAAGEPASTLVRVAVAFIALAVVAQAVGVGDVYLAEHVALLATNRLRAELTRHCLALDLAFHASHRPGELIERIDGDSANLANFLSRFLVALIGNALLLLGVVAMLCFVDPRIGALLLAIALVVVAISARYRRFGRPYWERSMQAEADLSGFLEEELSGTEDIRSSGATPYAMRRHAEHSREVLRRIQQASLFGNVVASLAGFAFRVGGTAALALAAWLFRKGELSIGEVFLVFAYTQVLIDPVQALGRQLEDLQTAIAAVQRVHELLDTESRLVDDGAEVLPDGALGVAFANVRFRYVSDATEPTLDDLSFAVEPGRVLGLLGRTGSGKTTIAKLLVRFYDPDGGAVALAGTDTRRVPLSEVRARVGLVTQDVHLFHATVRDNLTLFDTSVDDDHIVAVLQELGLGGWLESLESGLDTTLAGDTGLSAGESQLLAFARVFLRDPGVVILDEATARLDPATERLVEAAITRLFAGRTAIVIAHRLATVARADDILILENGRIAEHGERHALAADSASRFARLLELGLEDARA